MSCQSKAQPTKIQGNGIGTYYIVTIAQPHNITKTAIDSVVSVLNNEASIFAPNSLVSRINRNETDSLSPMLEDILELSLRISHQTDGAFDCTVGALVNLWGFGKEDKGTVTDAQVQEALATVGYQKIKIENHRIVKENPKTQLNFNAIAKGLCVEMVADYLRAQGIENFLIDIGGEMVLSGLKAPNTPWRIGVQKPTQTATGPMVADSVLTLTNKAIATSGNYRNYIEENGVRYAHTMNPKTGYPEKSTLLSATVIANDCAIADALATAFMVMGGDKARSFQEKNKNIEIYLIEN